MKDAAQRKFDVVAVYKLDRFGRSVLNLNQHLASLTSYGIRFISISQGIVSAKPIRRATGARHRSALSGAVRGESEEDAYATDGGGRDLQREAGQVADGSVQSGNGRTAVVGQRAEERDAGRVFRTELSSRQRKAIEAACVDMWEPFR